MATKKKAKKKKALTVGEMIPRKRHEFHWPLERSTS